MQRHMSEGVKENFLFVLWRGVIFSLSFLLTYKSVWQRRREPELTVEVTGVELQQNKKRRLLIQPRVHSQWEGPSGAGEL